jgi:hypothetical protein
MTVTRIADDVKRHVETLLGDWRAAAEEERQSLIASIRQDLESELGRRLEDVLARERDEWAASQQRMHADLEVADERARRAETEAAASAAAQRDAEQRLAEAHAAWAPTEEGLRADLRVAQAQATEALGTLEETERSVRAGERESRLAAAVRLLESIERLDGCLTLRATLDALVDGVAAEVPRTMLLTVRGGALHGWQLRGVAQAPEVAQLAVDRQAIEPLARATHSGIAVATTTDVFAAPLDFLRLPIPCTGLVVPVRLGLRTVAVVYADDGGNADREVPAGWPEVVQLLARHASSHLRALTAMRTVAMAARGPAQATSGEFPPHGGDALPAVATGRGVAE